MPYGSFSRNNKEPAPPITRRRYYRASQNANWVFQDTSQLVFGGPITAEYLSRSGGKTSPAALRAAAGLDGSVTTYELVAKQIHNGPRLAFRVWSKKLNKYVWAREPIIVYRLLPRRKKIPMLKRGLDLPPQPLSFSCFTQKNYPENATIDVEYNDGSTAPYFLNKCSYEGPLWKSFTPYLGSALPFAEGLFSSPTISSSFAPYVTSADSAALSGLYEKAKNQKVNLAQAFAERAQTAKMFVDILYRLASAAALAKKGNLAGAAARLFPKNTKGLANDWLMYQYGIRPLISDVKGCVDYMLNGEALQFDVISRVTRQVPRVVSTITHTPALPGESTYISWGYVTVSYKVRCVVDAPLIRDLDRLGFTNLPSLAWELTPYSFVADWFLPIGDYLNNMDAFSSLRFVFGHKTVFQKEYVSMSRRFGGVKTSGSNTFRCSQLQLEPIVIERVNCVRTVLQSLPPIGRPLLKDPLSATHIANALALLRQLR